MFRHDISIILKTYCLALMFKINWELIEGSDFKSEQARADGSI